MDREVKAKAAQVVDFDLGREPLVTGFVRHEVGVASQLRETLRDADLGSERGRMRALGALEEIKANGPDMGALGVDILALLDRTGLAHIRVAAIETIGELKLDNPNTVNSLFKILAEEKVGERIEAANALGKTRNPEVAERLEVALKSEQNNEVQQHIAQAINSLKFGPGSSIN